MFRQIMVPLDGSARAERALPCAAPLAKAMGATVHLIRVADFHAPLTWAPGAPYLPQSAYETELAHVQAYITAIRERLGGDGLHARSEVLTGSAGLALLDYERAANIELVVMSSHGRSGLVRFALGSVAGQLLRHGSAPILLVRAFRGPPDLSRVLVPLDGSTHAEAAFTVLQALTPSLVHEVTLLRVVDRQEDEAASRAYLAAVAQQLEWEHVVCRVERGEPAETIVEAAGEEPLVLMATHGRSDVTRWALGSVADRVSRDGVAGVLLVRTAAHASLLVSREPR